MKKLKDIFLVIGTLAMILAIGSLIILAIGAIVYAIGWLWSQIPFGIAGFILGVLVIAFTFLITKSLFPERKFKPEINFIGELKTAEICGYIFGFFLIWASFIWFVLPNRILSILPSFGTVLTYLFVATLIFYGATACIAVGIISLRGFFLGSLFYLGCGIFGVWLVNMPVWNYTEKLPDDYYFFGKFIFAFLILLEICYTIFFQLLPIAHQERLKFEADKKGDLHKVKPPS